MPPIPSPYPNRRPDDDIRYILADELSVWNRPTLRIEKKEKNGIYHCLDKSKVPDKIEIYITERKKGNIIRIVPDRAHTTLKKTFSLDIPCLKRKNDPGDYSRLLGYRIDVVYP